MRKATRIMTFNVRTTLAKNLFGDGRTPPWAEPGPSRRMSSAEYAAYLRSPPWREKSKNVMYRCKYWCEWIGCNDRAVNVHHLTYANVPNEPLTDLIAVCRRHHVNAEYDRTRPLTHRNEGQLCLPSVHDDVCQVCWREWARHVLYNVSLCRDCHRDYLQEITRDELAAYAKLRLAVQPVPQSLLGYADEILANS
jgi:hypothetical protein